MATRKRVSKNKRSTRSSRKQSGGMFGLFESVKGLFGSSNNAVKNNDSVNEVPATANAAEGVQAGGKRRGNKRGAK